jgi:hypothetical protein
MQELCPNQGEGLPLEQLERIRNDALGDRALIEVVLALCAKVDALEAALKEAAVRAS